MMNCFGRVWTEEGPRALWRGNLANIIRYFPTQAISLSVKDRYQGAGFLLEQKALFQVDEIVKIITSGRSLQSRIVH